MSHPLELSRRHAALLAFASVVVTLVGVAVAGASGALLDFEAVRDPGVAVRLASAPHLRVGVLGWVLAILGDVARAWALYVFFRGVNESVAMLGAWCMLLHDAVFGVSLAALLVAGDVAVGAGPNTASSGPFVSALFQAHLYGFQLGLAFFSFHLLLNAALAFASREVPKVIVALLVLAFFGYLSDATLKVLLPVAPAWWTRAVSLPNAVGELALMAWLLARGGRSSSPRAPRFVTAT